MTKRVARAARSGWLFLFGVVDRLAQPGCVEGVEDGTFGIGAVPGFGGDGPDDSICVAVGGNGNGCAGIDELWRSFVLAVAPGDS